MWKMSFNTHKSQLQICCGISHHMDEQNITRNVVISTESITELNF